MDFLGQLVRSAPFFWRAIVVPDSSCGRNFAFFCCFTKKKQLQVHHQGARWFQGKAEFFNPRGGDRAGFLCKFFRFFFVKTPENFFSFFPRRSAATRGKKFPSLLGYSERETHIKGRRIEYNMMQDIKQSINREKISSHNNNRNR